MRESKAPDAQQAPGAVSSPRREAQPETPARARPDEQLCLPRHHHTLTLESTSTYVVVTVVATDFMFGCLSSAYQLHYEPIIDVFSTFIARLANVIEMCT